MLHLLPGALILCYRQLLHKSEPCKVQLITSR
jgi:hypothetical protein